MNAFFWARLRVCMYARVHACMYVVTISHETPEQIQTHTLTFQTETHTHTHTHSHTCMYEGGNYSSISRISGI